VRVYSDEDVEVLKQLRRLMDEGYKLQWAFEKAREGIATE
jgi:MerR HTH family regulatory protein